MSIPGYDVLLRAQEFKKAERQQRKGGENEITDLFLATPGCKAIMKVSIMLYPTNLEDLTFEKISHNIRTNTEAQEKIGRGRKNEIHVDETRN